MNKESIINLLKDVQDPEVPVLDVVSMGVVRDVDITSGKTIVTITPTYTGCPAMNTIENEIIEKLKSKGIENVEIKTVFSPAWTTDWLSDETKQRLKDYGIAPPGKSDESDFLKSFFSKIVECPFCGSENTKVTSEFGSTACKSLHFCNNCTQPFEHFKCI